MRGEQIRAILAQLRGGFEDETVQRTDGGTAAPDEYPAGRIDDVTTVGEFEPEASELEVEPPNATALATQYGSSVPTDLVVTQSELLAETLDQRGPDRAETVASVAHKQAEAGVLPSMYVGSYIPLIERIVEEGLTDLSGEDAERAREQILSGLSAAFDDMQVGVDEFADSRPAEREIGTIDAGIGVEGVLEAMPFPAFLVDAQDTVVEYNEGLCHLLNLGEGHCEFIGEDCRETIAGATYTDGRRHYSLADKVVENPRDGDSHWDIERVDGEYEHSDLILYRDRSVTKDQAGEETHIEFLAVPMFDDTGELTFVLELVWDRTEEVVRERALEGLITDVSTTLQSIGEGNLEARATFEDEQDALDAELLSLTTEINEMATNFEEIIHEVDRTTSDLADSIKQTTEQADRIDESAGKQVSSLETAAEEMSNVSATMEEVAGTSGEVAETADSALDEVERGLETGSDAQVVTEDVLEMSESLVDTVEELDEYVDEIGTVVEVIDGVAEQTNMLALNANIEAARASTDGAGFAVVAEEIKSLATETQEHTDEIAARVEQIQSQTETTVEEVGTSRKRMQEVVDELSELIAVLDSFSEEIQEVAGGIRQVSDGNDSQADAVETVAAEIDDIRDRSIQVANAVDDIAEETETQEQIVFELSEHVEELSSQQQ